MDEKSTSPTRTGWVFRRRRSCVPNLRKAGFVQVDYFGVARHSTTIIKSHASTPLFEAEQRVERLFVSERDDRINRHGAPGRQVSREQGNSEKQERDADERDAVDDIDPIENAA
jgi:hypothetical protein